MSKQEKITWVVLVIILIAVVATTIGAWHAQVEADKAQDELQKLWR